MYLTSKSGARIAITERLVPHAPATMILLHGFLSSRQSGNITAALDVINAHGLNAIAPDFYGRGDSDGAFGDLTVAKGLETVETVLDHIRRKNPNQKIILTGGSFGGLIALYATAQFQSDIDLLILRAPVSDWHAVWLAWIGAEKLRHWGETGSFTDTLPSGKTVTFGPAFYNDLGCDDIYNDVAAHITVPTLIVHGDADDTVPLAQSEKLNDVLPDSRLIVLPGADHIFSRSSDSAAYQMHMLDFLTENKIV